MRCSLEVLVDDFVKIEHDWISASNKFCFKFRDSDEMFNVRVERRFGLLLRKLRYELSIDGISFGTH
jgi:hypothetical protein